MTDNSSAKFAFGIANSRLYRFYMLYLEMEEILQSTSHNYGLESAFLLLNYATTSWVLHLRESQVIIACKGDLQELHFDVIWPSETSLQLWIQIYGLISPYDPGCPLKGTTPAHVASRHQLMDWLKEILQKADRVHTTLSARDAAGRTALSSSNSSLYSTRQKLLINIGNADVNSKDSDKRTPLSRAAANGHKAVVRLFLDIGREITVTEEVVGDAATSRTNAKEVMKLLLDRRGDEVAITEEVVKAAAGNEDDGKKVMALLLDQRREEVVITEEVVKAAAACGQNDVPSLLSAYDLVPVRKNGAASLCFTTPHAQGIFLVSNNFYMTELNQIWRISEWQHQYGS